MTAGLSVLQSYDKRKPIRSGRIAGDNFPEGKGHISSGSRFMEGMASFRKQSGMPWAGLLMLCLGSQEALVKGE